jgi:hypothetical protein
LSVHVPVSNPKLQKLLKSSTSAADKPSFDNDDDTKDDYDEEEDDDDDENADADNESCLVHPVLVVYKTKIHIQSDINRANLGKFGYSVQPMSRTTQDILLSVATIVSVNIAYAKIYI